VAMALPFADSSAIRYVIPVFWMTSFFHIIDRISQNQRRHTYFVQFARWRHRGEVCRPRLYLAKFLRAH